MATLEDLRDDASTRLGRVLRGKWRLDALLGVGGMAAVYAATHRNQKRVAVKVLHRVLAADRRLAARFLREGYLANSVGHPGVVTVDDDDTDEDGAPFLVMELLEGETLDDMRRVAGGRLSPERALPLFASLLDVLVVAHDKGIIHRDLKPENLFVLGTGALKVLDFGLARARELDGQSALTQPDALLGTPAFMAPEQAVGRWDLVDGRTDLWAVGATAFRVLTGSYVHEATTLQELVAKAATAPARPTRSLAPELPAELCAVLDRSLAFSKADRFADARAMLSALRDAARGLGVALPETPERPRPQGTTPSLDADPSLPATSRTMTSDATVLASSSDAARGPVAVRARSGPTETTPSASAPGPSPSSGSVASPSSSPPPRSLVVPVTVASVAGALVMALVLSRGGAPNRDASTGAVAPSPVVLAVPTGASSAAASSAHEAASASSSAPPPLASVRAPASPRRSDAKPEPPAAGPAASSPAPAASAPVAPVPVAPAPSPPAGNPLDRRR